MVVVNALVIRRLHSGRSVSELEFFTNAETETLKYLLKDYSEKLDELLIQKFNEWENSDWKNTLGKPILNWQSVLQKNMIMFDSHRSFENTSALKIPEIKRPKLN